MAITSNNAELEFSRQVATASTLRGAADGDVEHFFEKAVLLTGDPEFLRTQNGKWIFIDCVLLLARMTKHLTVEVREGGALAREISELTNNLTKHEVTIVTRVARYEEFEAILSVGQKVEPSLPWTAINSNGWVARVSSVKTVLSGECSQENPIGALAAACLGVAEVFKRLIQLKPERGELHDGFVFSFYSYSPDEIPGPTIAHCQVGSLLLVGAGAIGNGIYHLMMQLPLEGQLSILDYQDFQDENLGTCLLVSIADLGKPKAEALAGKFKTTLGVKPFRQTVSTFLQDTLGKDVPYPRIILNGLDNIDARREVQTMWPDLIIDGAIGPLSCQVTLHPWGPDLSCLMCDFEQPAVSATKIQSDLTGLSESRLSNLLDVVTEDDVQDAPAEKKQFLAKHVGKQICALLSENEVEALSRISHDENFQPSVPFVACLSSCMIVTELLRSVTNDVEVLETGYQCDALVGPQNGIKTAHGRKKACVCVNRRNIIESLRARR